MDLGARLAEQRRGRRQSLKAVAGAAGISTAYLQKLERCEVKAPSPHVLRALAGALDVDYTDLLGLAGYLDPAGSGVDRDRIERAVRELLEAVGEDPDRDGLQRTPSRVADLYADVTEGLHHDPGDHLAVTFDAGHDEMVMVRDIPMASLCEHHLAPFVGRAHVAYIPGASGRITGLSKLARLVDLYARRPQVQERLTTQVADSVMQILEPRGVMVVFECEHLCMTMRGVRKPRSKTVTSAVRGQLRDPATRAEAMSLILS